MRVWQPTWQIAGVARREESFSSLILSRLLNS